MGELHDFIARALAAGQAEEVVRAALLAEGWDEATVTAAFAAVQSEQSVAMPGASAVTQPTRHRWLWRTAAFLLVVVVGGVVLWVVNPPLPAGSDLLKKHALQTLLSKGEEVFMKDGKVTNSGLCLFMSMNQSYQETVSDPAWEFQCYDSDTAFAAELRLNDGTYRCVDSQGNTIDASISVIYGPECLAEGDERLNQDQYFSTTMDFKSDPGAVAVVEPPKLVTDRLQVAMASSSQLTALIERTKFNCGDFYSTAEGTTNLTTGETFSIFEALEVLGTQCLSQKILDGCDEAAQRYVLAGAVGTTTISIFGVMQDADGRCVTIQGFNDADTYRYIQCGVDIVLNANFGLEYSFDQWREKYVLPGGQTAMDRIELIYNDTPSFVRNALFDEVVSSVVQERGEVVTGDALNDRVFNLFQCQFLE